MIVTQAVEDFQQRIRTSAQARSPLRIRGGGSKDFYAAALRGDVLDTRGFTGVVEYDPTELTITARAGTPLAEIEAVMGERGQMLAFEPPHFGAATLGGAVAAGLSGPRRASAGALRDFVLGVSMLDGKGELLRFGGQVMKNVAGYDLSRLMAGSMGTLGLILDVSLKALPLPFAEQTLRLEMPPDVAIRSMNQWAAKPLPISATCYDGEMLYLRLSGAERAVASARDKLGGELQGDGASFWRSVREHKHPFFAATQPLWRISLPSATPPLVVAGEQLVEWGGALRWLVSGAPAVEIRRAAASLGGSATLFRSGADGVADFAPLAPAILVIHQRLKAALDPAGIFGPGRLYPEL